jgi:type II secretory pathway pseudopilin PulG
MMPRSESSGVANRHVGRTPKRAPSAPRGNLNELESRGAVFTALQASVMETSILPDPSTQLSAASATSVLTDYYAQGSSVVYDADMSGDVLARFAVIFAVLLGTALYWWQVVIPQQRTRLAISKSRGQVKQLLDQLVTDDGTANGTSSSTITTDNCMTTVTSETSGDSAVVSNGNDGFSAEQKSLLRWFFSDWLDRREGRRGGKKPAAIPVFSQGAKWNSGDNPILVAFGGIMACVIAASLAERVGGAL